MRGLMHLPFIARAAALMAIYGTTSACSTAAAAPEIALRTPVRQGTPVVMFVGDSFTVGSGPVPRWHAYATEAARLLGWQPIVAGAGGTGYLSEGRVGRTFQQSFKAELAWRPAPDVLVISGGHNDCRWSSPKVRRAATTLLQDAKATWPRAEVVMVGPIWMGRAPAKAYRVRDVLAEVAERQAVPFLDPMRERWTAGGKAEMTLPDGVHPTHAGHVRLGTWLAGALSRLPHQGP
jgi:lysophospholipase L1-like esterase